MNQYEAMFLFDPSFGTAYESCEQEIQRLMGRAEAEILFCRKWEERRLAYRIRGRKRGVYVLTYFKCHPSRIVGLERDATLSEHILRLLVLRADEVTPEDMEQACPLHAESAPRSDSDISAAPRSADSAKPAASGAAVATESSVAEVPKAAADTE